jgi:hypothetical protein
VTVNKQSRKFLQASVVENAQKKQFNPTETDKILNRQPTEKEKENLKSNLTAQRRTKATDNKKSN